MVKNQKIFFSSKINSSVCQCLYYVSAIPPVPSDISKRPVLPVLWPKRQKTFSQKCHFWPILVLKVTCVFGPINRGSFGPNGHFPGTFWPKPSLLGSLRSLKKIWVKTLVTIFFWHFQILGILGGFECDHVLSEPAGPQNGSKTPNPGQKRVLVITLARQNISTHIYTQK